MKKSSVLLGLILLAALIAFGPSLALGQPARDPERTLRPFWEEYLDLTPDQKAKLEEFRKARQEERKAFLDQMEKFRTELRELRKNPQANEKKIDALIDEMFKLRAGRLKSSFKHQAEIKKIFTPEQQEKLAKLRARMAHMREMRPGAFFGRGGGRPGLSPHPFWGRGPLRPRLRDRWWW
ncbi:MAG: Spy/CpxP family protein refolding chaperone [Clostridiales bacterium]|nr:Spy/CpxP family protein refolding chaperone [Clostridiales bacterium]